MGIIEWTDESWSPWGGCSKVNDECARCYADVIDQRFYGADGGHWGPKRPRRRQTEDYWQKPLAWNRRAAKLGRRLRVFPSVCDPFEDRPDLVALRERFWILIQNTPHLDWLLLTKRPENFGMLPWVAAGPILAKAPWPNVWLGVSCGRQVTADEMVPQLLATPAVLRFVSYEPALEPVDFSRWLPRIDWLIAGAESGAGARPMQEEWIRSVRNQCTAAATPFFYKQKLEGKRKVSLPLLDGKCHAALPFGRGK